MGDEIQTLKTETVDESTMCNQLAEVELMCESIQKLNIHWVQEAFHASVMKLNLWRE